MLYRNDNFLKVVIGEFTLTDELLQSQNSQLQTTAGIQVHSSLFFPQYWKYWL